MFDLEYRRGRTTRVTTVHPAIRAWREPFKRNPKFRADQFTAQIFKVR